MTVRDCFWGFTTKYDLKIWSQNLYCIKQTTGNELIF